jgi:hypothetical protein
MTIERRQRQRRHYYDAGGREIREPLAVRVIFRLWSLVAYSNTTPTRFMLALAATCWAILLAWPGDTFQRPVYFYMSRLAPEWAWMVLWGIHAAGMWWRCLAESSSPKAALAVNVLGVFLFAGSAAMIFLTLTYPLPAAIATDIVLAMAAIWVLIRTHVNSDDGWKGD